MGMVVKNNMNAVRTLNTLNSNTAALSKSLQKVSSGMKINSAQDDASGYAISERMRVRIRSLDQANQNSQNDSSLMKTAEGAVGNTVEILRALKEKAINAANDSNTDEDRQTIQKEIDQLIDQIDDNALVQFNGKYLIDGTKNNVFNEDGTKTILLNQSLDASTKMSSNLTDLRNRAGDSLGILDTDKYQVSWVQNGKINFTSGTLKGMTLSELLSQATGTEACATENTGLISGEKPVPPDPEDYRMSTDMANYTAVAAPSTVTPGTIGVATGTPEVRAKAAFDAIDGLKKSDGSVLTSANIASIGTTGSITFSGGYYAQVKSSDGEYSAKEVTLKLVASSDGAGGAIYTLQLTPSDVYSSTTTGWSPSTSIPLYTKVDPSAAAANATTVDAPDKFGKAVYTPDKTAGVAVAAGSAGVSNQLSGLTISILDQDGNVKKAANAALDQFKQYQRAENFTGDMSLNFHIGSEANVAIKVGMGDMRSEALGLKGSNGNRIDVFTKEHANAAINVIENALTKALDQQTTIGAIEARLEYTSTNLTTSSENVQAAESTIRDADMAKEMTNYTKSNVLLQAAQAMLAQANQNSSAVLSLLQ